MTRLIDWLRQKTRDSGAVKIVSHPHDKFRKSGKPERPQGHEHETRKKGLNSLLSTGRCPDCAGTTFFQGPESGINCQWQCANPECGSWFNLAIVAGRISAVDRVHKPKPPKDKDNKNEKGRGKDGG
jgi:hypothetical protein